ncbi:hypothetical protein GJ496_007868, partial [Pomphorhynchus laevis]
MLWTEYDKKIHNTFLGNKDLYLFTEYGLDPGRKELRLRSDEYTFDLFGQENNYRCLYPPINEICSADLVGLRMSKRGPMDKFIKSRQLVAEDTSNSEADDGVIETEVLPSKRIRTVFTRKYDSSYIQFGFVATNDGEVPKPLCVICGDVLANHSMKPSHLKRHLNTKHKEMSSKSKECFARKHVDLKSRQKQIFKVSRTNTCALRASYK